MNSFNLIVPKSIKLRNVAFLTLNATLKFVRKRVVIRVKGYFTIWNPTTMLRAFVCLTYIIVKSAEWCGFGSDDRFY